MTSYAGAASVFDVMAFKYVEKGIGGATNQLFKTLKKGGAVPEGALKRALIKTGFNANARGLAEGTQESFGDGLLLDALAKTLFDDDRKLITRCRCFRYYRSNKKKI